ncbi:type II toxin-antitoxin system RelE/ParE family toxin [Rhizobium sp. CG5]|uniref:type II toxin-antitoxin system RelE/ParE family toxin n=1 Tax=Rhizobium sp. CG5 TaxID=2726076 RepID=UPI00331E3B09|nr:type II toxin-antitoxin system RelE/ParE family toxin [Rhizobium sp. CG5]
MRYTVTRHPLVRSDMLDITRLIGDYAGYPIAGQKIAEFRSAMKSLRDYPHIGTVRHDIHPGLRALPAGEKGVICFTVDDRTETVHIVCVTYAGADWQARARGRS